MTLSPWPCGQPVDQHRHERSTRLHPNPLQLIVLPARCPPPPAAKVTNIDMGSPSPSDLPSTQTRLKPSYCAPSRSVTTVCNTILSLTQMTDHNQCRAPLENEGRDGQPWPHCARAFTSLLQRILRATPLRSPAASEGCEMLMGLSESGSFVWHITTAPSPRAAPNDNGKFARSLVRTSLRPQ